MLVLKRVMRGSGMGGELTTMIQSEMSHGQTAVTHTLPVMDQATMAITPLMVHRLWV